MLNLLQSLWPVRWWRTLVALTRGVRIHPSALLLGGPGRIQIERGAKLGARLRCVAAGSGRVHIGARVWCSTDVEIETEGEVHIGAGTTIQRRCTINGNTRIGAGCILAPNVFISSGTHPFREMPELPIREQERRLGAVGMAALDRPVWVHDDCWLGVNVVVCPGVTIGQGSVVGANAVVTKDVPAYSVVAGIPARVIGSRLEPGAT